MVRESRANVGERISVQGLDRVGHRGRDLGLILVVVALGSACTSTEATQIVVAIDTDLKVPTEIDSIEIRA